MSTANTLFVMIASILVFLMTPYQSAEASFCKQDAACHDGYGRQGRADPG